MLPKSFTSTLRFLLATPLLAKPLAFLHLWLLQVLCIPLSQLYLIFENQRATVSFLHTTFGLSVDFFFPYLSLSLQKFSISQFLRYLHMHTTLQTDDQVITLDHPTKLWEYSNLLQPF